MSPTIETATESHKKQPASARAQIGESGFEAALLGSVGKSLDVAAAHETAEVGRGSASAAPGKRRDDEKEVVKRARAMTDPSAIAAGQLATHGVPKATVQAAEAQQVTAGPKPEQPRARSAGGTSQPSSPNQLNPQAKAPGGAEARIGSGRHAAAPSNGTKAGSGDSSQKQSAAHAHQHLITKAFPTTTRSKPVDATQALSRLAQAINRGAERTTATTSANRSVLRVETARIAQKGTPPRSAAPAPNADRAQQAQDDFAAQLGRGFSAVLRQNGGSLTLRMQPQELGDLTIKMEMKPGQVTADFEVGSDQARQLLTDHMTSLRSALEARGLSVDKLTVHVSERQTPEALANRAELGNGTHDGGASGGRGDQSGAEHPQFATVSARSARNDSAVSVPGNGPEVQTGGAQTVRLVLDAVA